MKVRYKILHFLTTLYIAQKDANGEFASFYFVT